jgi:ribosome biogenesis GTPase A
MEVQWYPGHMTKAKRNMQEDVKLVDLIIELVDARVPLSSRNPDIDKLAQGKARLILMNKSDLADQAVSAQWKLWFEEKGCQVVLLDARVSGQMKQVHRAIEEACKEKRERDRRRGILNRPIRAMVVGIPNVGKSTFINSFAGRAAAKTGNKPGVTKGNQWIRLNKNVELLDTPGILWPKFDDKTVGLRLAAIGSISDNVLDITELSAFVIQLMEDRYSGSLSERYGLKTDETGHVLLEQETDSEQEEQTNADGAPVEKRYRILAEIARKRGCIIRGGELDYEKAARLILDDFRSGRLGKVTLETPVL